MCQTPWLMSALAAVRDVGAPEAYFGGGVLRALAWDFLHGYAKPTPLRDVDVAFFDPERLSPERDLEVEQALFERIPDVPSRPFGAADLMGQILRRNPRRVSAGIFEKRLLEKRILEHWPGVRIMRDTAEDPKVRSVQ